MRSFILMAALAAVQGGVAAVHPPLNLAGEWRFRSDAPDSGVREQWFNQALPDRIALPGSTDEQGKGPRNENREPGHLTRPFEYVGPAWYQRDVEIPADWAGSRITLFLERCHWESQVWLDGVYVGLQNSLSTPHVHELPPGLKPGSHRLSIRVDNRLKIDVGASTAVTEEGPGNWNGIVGRMELRATGAVWIDSVRVYPDPTNRAARARVRLRNLTGVPHAADLAATAVLRGNPTERRETSARIAISDRPQSEAELDIPLGATARPWSEFSPDTYSLTISLRSAEPDVDFEDQSVASFGMRAFGMQGRYFSLNGRTVLLRGNVDNGAFPLHGYPPSDAAEWRRRLKTYQDYGFNHVRFHSWCPPEAAFTAADELGMILQVENPLWVGHGRVSADAARTAFIRQEAERIVDTYGNHPSFCLMTMGNELGNGADPFLGELVTALRRRDPRHLYSSTTAPDNVTRPDDYFVSAGPRWQHLRGDPRLEQRAPDTDSDYRQYLAPLDRPVIAHELGQWTVFPDLREAARFKGPLQPRYLDLYRESLQAQGLLERAEEFRRASGAFTVELYKEEIESIFRTPGLAGFQLLGLADYPGFGPAFIGVLDALNQSKGLVDPGRFRRFCNSTVPLLRMTKRVWNTGEIFTAAADLAHYGEREIEGVQPAWSVRDGSGAVVASGRLGRARVPSGSLHALGEVRFPLGTLAAPARYSVELIAGEWSNDWSIWVYPAAPQPAPRDVQVTADWSEARRHLEEGRTVLYLAPVQRLAHAVPASFTTAFWSLRWFPRRHETMGVLCDPAHPALARFPTATHADWQWWDLTSQSRALVLDSLPAPLTPIVRVIDDAARNHRLAAVFEARAGSGRLLVSAFDLETRLESRPAARQLRESLLQYAASSRFAPAVELDLQRLDELFASSPPDTASR